MFRTRRSPTSPRAASDDAYKDALTLAETHAQDLKDQLGEALEAKREAQAYAAELAAEVSQANATALDFANLAAAQRSRVQGGAAATSSSTTTTSTVDTEPHANVARQSDGLHERAAATLSSWRALSPASTPPRTPPSEAPVTPPPDSHSSTKTTSTPYWLPSSCYGSSSSSSKTRSSLVQQRLSAIAIPDWLGGSRRTSLGDVDGDDAGNHDQASAALSPIGSRVVGASPSSPVVVEEPAPFEVSSEEPQWLQHAHSSLSTAAIVRGPLEWSGSSSTPRRGACGGGEEVASSAPRTAREEELMQQVQLLEMRLLKQAQSQRQQQQAQQAQQHDEEGRGVLQWLWKPFANMGPRGC